MSKILLRCTLTLGLGWAFLVSISTALAADADLRMLSLAMHQETGRNIYLGAIHVDEALPNPDDILQVPPPLKMEYRIVARRTSIRSLLGNMLLQSEVANGQPPGAPISDLADQLLSRVQGSLYAGDSFVLLQDTEGQVSALLNGAEIAAVQDNGTFHYLLLGWVSENGPASAFRSNILRPEIDGSLYSAYEAHSPSEERVATVAAWLEPQELVAQEENIPSATDSVATEAIAAVAVVAATDTLALETRQSSAIAPAAAESVPGAVPAEAPIDIPGNEAVEEVEVAIVAEEAAIPVATEPSIVETEIAAPDEIGSIDVTEYSHRLAGFNTALIKLVYSKIHYPRRAVRRDIQGHLELDITMQQDGSLIEVAVAESSGYSLLDGAAVEAAEQALAEAGLGEIDPVAIAEYGSGDNVVVPVPVAFILQ